MRKQLLTSLASALLPVFSASGLPLTTYGYTRSYLNNVQSADNTQLKNYNEKYLAKPLSTTEQLLVMQQAAISVSDESQLLLQQGQAVDKLIIIDAAVPDKHLFYQQIKPGVDVVEITSLQDGLMQLQQTLANYQHLSALHIVSHANDGVLYLGNSEVTQATLGKRLNVLSSIDNALKDGADVLLYGCDLAKTTKGEMLLELIANQANVDIAASNNLTGAASKGGDWTLEIVKGNIEAEPLSEIALKDFSSVLIDKTIIMDNFTLGVNAKSNMYTFNTNYTARLSIVDENGAPPDANSLLCADSGYNDVFCYVDPGLVSTKDNKLYFDFSTSQQFDVASIELISITSDETFTISSDKGDTVNASLMNSTFTTINLNWTGITKLTIEEQGGADINRLGLDDFILTNISPPNTAPTISIENATLSYLENDLITQVDSAAALTDINGDTGWNGGTLVAQITVNNEADDELSIPDNVVGNIHTSGNDLFDNATVIGSLSTSEGVVTNGTALTITFNSNATNALVQQVLRAIHYRNTSNNPSTSNKTITFTAADTDTNSNTDTRTVVITAVNDKPNTTIDADSTNEDSAVTIDVLANDSDSDGSLTPASVTVVSSPSNGGTTVNTTTGMITYMPNVNFDGPTDSFTYTVEDNNGLASATTTVTVTVNPLNDSPIAVADSANTTTNTSVAIDVAANDTDVDTGDTPDPTTIVVVGSATHGAAVFNGVTNRVDYTSNVSFTGTDSFTYTIDDGIGATSNVATVTVNVIAANIAPTANNDLASIDENTSININVLSNDNDADGTLVSSSVTIQAQPDNGIASVNTGNGQITYTPNNGFSGSDSFTYRVRDDDNANSNTATVTITVNSANQPPVAEEQSLFTNENIALAIILSATDADDDTLTYAIVEQPANGVISGAAPNLTYTPNNDYVGDDSFSFKVNDATDDSNTATVTITVNNVNQPPVAEEQSLFTNKNVALAIILSATDADDDTLTYAIVEQPVNGVISGAAPNLTYTPNNDYVGDDSFSFYVNDGTDDSNTATISVFIVEQENSLPIAINDDITLIAGEAINIEVLTNDIDSDGDTLTIVSVSTPLIGSVSIIDNASVLYQSDASFIGEIVVEYVISDGKGGYAMADIIIHVLSADDPELPVISLPDDISINAAGLFTIVNLGVATAIDQHGIPIPVSLLRTDRFFTSGRHQAYWEAIDTEGKRTIATQLVKVNPQIHFSVDQTVIEGATVKVEVHLNGDSPEYPLEIDFSVSGTANSSDHDLISRSITIDSGHIGYLQFTTLLDDEAETDEYLSIDLASSLNTLKSSHIVTITEKNVAAEITLNAKQNGDARLFHTQAGGDITIESDLRDANFIDTYSYNWNKSDSPLIDIDDDITTFTFSPELLSLGTYSINLAVSDGSTPALISEKTLFVEIVESLAMLTTADSDNDGIPDIDEGFTDLDVNGIPDYQDNSNNCHVLVEKAFNTNFVIEGDVDGCLSLGNAAVGNASGGARLVDGELQSNPTPEDINADSIGGIFDFVAHQLSSIGQNYHVVIPQVDIIPDDALYRKFDVNRGWYNFIEDEKNHLASALGSQGYCPSPNSDEFEQGLVAGYWCVRLTIEDGGPNDNDGRANGAIFDLGGVAIVGSSNTSPIVIDEQVIIGKNEKIIIEPLFNDTDIDDDVLVLMYTSAIHGTINVEGNNIEYSGPLNYLGTDEISYVVSDGNGGSASGKVNITIINRAPLALNDKASTTENTSITIYVLSNDTDADNNALVVISATAGFGSVTINSDQSIVYTPNKEFTGNDIIKYAISDGVGGTANAEVNVQVMTKPNSTKSSSGTIGSTIFWVLIAITVIRLRGKRVNKL